MAHGGTGRQIALAAILAGAVSAFLSVAAVGHAFFDLEIYYGALRHWVRDGGELYEWLKPDTRYGFTYPPFAALVMLPMAYLPWPAVLAVYLAGTVLAGVLVLWWLVDPLARRMGWTRWFALFVALALAAAFEPMRETVDFGQVNVLLLALVAMDLLRLLPRGSRWAGIGIGLATAIKLTPGIFIVYLLVTGRQRAMLRACGTVAGAILLSAAVAPDASREFWTTALWSMERVGEPSFISNQSLHGVVARLDPEHPVRWWLPLVAAVVAFWVWRARAAVAARDEMTGLALTGVAMCLVSPVTWVHHLVWLLPALVLMLDNALLAAPGSRRRRSLLVLTGVTYVLLTSRLVWRWEYDPGGLAAFLGGNAYVWAGLALLSALPIRRQRQHVAQFRQFDRPLERAVA